MLCFFLRTFAADSSDDERFCPGQAHNIYLLTNNLSKKKINMRIEAIIKTVGNEEHGVSPRTGNPWKTRQLLLEMHDAENEAAGLSANNYISVGVFDEEADFMADAAGRRIECLLDICTVRSRSGWISNQVRIHNIRLL